MVRILKVEDLEERKRALMARSEMYRQTMRLEIANVKYGVALTRRRFGFLKFLPVSAGVLGALAGFLFWRKRAKPGAPNGEMPGVVGRMLAAVKWVSVLRPVGSEAQSPGSGRTRPRAGTCGNFHDCRVADRW